MIDPTDFTNLYAPLTDNDTDNDHDHDLHNHHYLNDDDTENVIDPDAFNVLGIIYFNFSTEIHQNFTCVSIC